MTFGRFTTSLLACAFPLVVGAAERARTLDAVPSQQIIGGTLDTGWPAVGALTYEGVGICTATLIGSQWVLTAAHCVHPDPGSGFSPTPQNLGFFMGNDVVNGPGTTAGVAVVHEHPSYLSNGADIALLALSAPVGAVVPLAYNTLDVAPYLGSFVTYVGFGAQTTFGSDDGGIKRKTTLEMTQLASDRYVSASTSTTGVCSGDGGGPGLVQSGEVWKVIGVTSTVASSGGNACLSGESYQMRTDYFASWIAGVMATGATDCRMDAGLCACPDACQDDGSCVDTVCPPVCVPADEACDGVDNDCDGSIDEGCSSGEQPAGGGGGCSAGGPAGASSAMLLLAGLATGMRPWRRRR